MKKERGCPEKCGAVGCPNSQPPCNPRRAMRAGNRTGMSADVQYTIKRRVPKGWAEEGGGRGVAWEDGSQAVQRNEGGRDQTKWGKGGNPHPPLPHTPTGHKGMGMGYKPQVTTHARKQRFFGHEAGQGVVTRVQSASGRAATACTHHPSPCFLKSPWHNDKNTKKGRRVEMVWPWFFFADNSCTQFHTRFLAVYPPSEASSFSNRQKSIPRL